MVTGGCPAGSYHCVSGGITWLREVTAVKYIFEMWRHTDLV
jgi:hypothetical protein